MNGLTFAAVAIHGESGAPDTLPWAQAAMDKLGMTMYCLGADGADHEGPGYWCGVEHLLKYMDVSRKILGVDFFNTRGLAKRRITGSTSTCREMGRPDRRPTSISRIAWDMIGPAPITS